MESVRLSPADRFLSVFPLFHHSGLGLAQLFAGGTVISTPGFPPGSFLAWLDQFQPTWFSLIPPVNRFILELARQHPEVFRRTPLRFVRSAGTPQNETLALLAKALGALVLTGYGLTETGVVTRSTPDALKLGSVGRPRHLLGAETEGEVILPGPSITSGYLDDREANQAAFRNGWFRSGDLGRLDGEGFLFLTDRLKKMINRGGEEILLHEVDEALAGHAAVADAACSPFHMKRWERT